MNVNDGDIFVLKTNVDVAISFLVVREYIDDSTVVLLVPLDDVFFVGSPDFDFTNLIGRPLVARCGQSFWFPKESLKEKDGHCSKVDRLSNELVYYIRNKLANLARGNSDICSKFVQSAMETDCDPNYEDHIQLVAQARVFVQDNGWGKLGI